MNLPSLNKKSSSNIQDTVYFTIERLENFIRQVGAFTDFHSMDKADQISIFLKIHGLLLDKDSKPKIKDGLNAEEAKIAAKSHYIELIKHVL